MKIVISGLTAAGKTTHAQLLAEDLGLSVISAASIFAQIMAEKSHRPHGQRWSPEMDEARLGDSSIDNELDRRISSKCAEQAGVFDACLLPWIAPRDDALYVWLDSGLASRTRKCYVSHLKDENLTLEQAGHRVLNKDQVTISRLQAARRMQPSPDPDLFHVIISNGDTIPNPTWRCAQEGIEKFHPIISQSVFYALGLSESRPLNHNVIQVRRQPLRNA